MLVRHDACADVLEHLGQQLQRQADHVRLAPLEHVDPAEAVLVAEGRRPFPPIGRRPGTRRVAAAERGSMRSVVVATRTSGCPSGTFHRQRPVNTRCNRPLSVPSICRACCAVGRLAQNLAVALDHRVAAENPAPGTPARQRRRPSDRPGGRPARPDFPRCRVRLRPSPPGHGPRTGSPLREQFPPPRRPAGQDQFGHRLGGTIRHDVLSRTRLCYDTVGWHEH